MSATDLPCSSKTELTNRFLCEHSSSGIEDGYRLRCPVCQSFWDLSAARDNFQYDQSYPALRQHHHPRIERLKVATLQRWLAGVDAELDNACVCEVGFGGGACLNYLKSISPSCYGIEAVEANIDHAKDLGLAEQNLFHSDHLPLRLPERIDFWLFQDSFEHLPDPAGFVDWMENNSTADSHVLIVAPSAGSISERLMGKLWPHKLPDHKFHWSRQGLCSFFENRGWQLEKQFYPLKRISLPMIISHLLHRFGIEANGLQRISFLHSCCFSFNFGEFGLVFGRGLRKK